MLGLLRRVTARHMIAIGGDDPEGVGCMTIVNHYHSYHIAGSVVTEREITDVVTVGQRRRVSYSLG